MTNAALYYELILCVDFALTIYMPFRTPSNRNKYYHLVFLFIYSIIFTFDNLNLSGNLHIYIIDYIIYCFIVPEKREIYTLSHMIVNEIFKIGYLIISLISLVYFGIKIKQMIKIHGKVKSLIIRYFIYGILCSVYIFCNVYNIFGSFFDSDEHARNVICFHNYINIEFGESNCAYLYCN